MYIYLKVWLRIHTHAGPVDEELLRLRVLGRVQEQRAVLEIERREPLAGPLALGVLVRVAGGKPAAGRGESGQVHGVAGLDGDEAEFPVGLGAGAGVGREGGGRDGAQGGESDGSEAHFCRDQIDNERMSVILGRLIVGEFVSGVLFICISSQVSNISGSDAMPS